jgi:hypothetical protein
MTYPTGRDLALGCVLVWPGSERKQSSSGWVCCFQKGASRWIPDDSLRGLGGVLHRTSLGEGLDTTVFDLASWERLSWIGLSAPNPREGSGESTADAQNREEQGRQTGQDGQSQSMADAEGGARRKGVSPNAGAHGRTWQEMSVHDRRGGGDWRLWRLRM